MIAKLQIHIRSHCCTPNSAWTITFVFPLSHQNSRGRSRNCQRIQVCNTGWQSVPKCPPERLLFHPNLSLKRWFAPLIKIQYKAATPASFFILIFATVKETLLFCHQKECGTKPPNINLVISQPSYQRLLLKLIRAYCGTCCDCAALWWMSEWMFWRGDNEDSDIRAHGRSRQGRLRLGLRASGWTQKLADTGV